MISPRREGNLFVSFSAGVMRLLRKGHITWLWSFWDVCVFDAEKNTRALMFLARQSGVFPAVQGSTGLRLKYLLALIDLWRDLDLEAALRSQSRTAGGKEEL